LNQAVRFAEFFEEKNDEKEAILDISILLVDFWVSSIKFLRNNDVKSKCLGFPRAQKLSICSTRLTSRTDKLWE
jgi:hypothetical protein